MGISNYFTLDGESSSDWGVGLSGTGVYDAPARKGESIYIPGRNGAIWVDGDAWENIELTYPCWMAEDFSDNIDDFRNFLLSHSDTYYRLTDTYHPNEYRLARYSGAFEAEPGTRNEVGRFDVTFDCDPRRFSTTTTAISLVADSTVTGGDLAPTQTITNDTLFPAYAVLHLTGSIYSEQRSAAIYLNIGGETVAQAEFTARASKSIDLSWDVYYNMEYGYMRVDGPDSIDNKGSFLWEALKASVFPAQASTVVEYDNSDNEGASQNSCTGTIEWVNI